MKYRAKHGVIYEESELCPERVEYLLNHQDAVIADIAAERNSLQDELTVAIARIAELERNGSHDRLRATQKLVDELRERNEKLEPQVNSVNESNQIRNKHDLEVKEELKTALGDKFDPKVMTFRLIRDLAQERDGYRNRLTETVDKYDHLIAECSTLRAVLAGVGQPDPPADLVEALAKVLHDAYIEVWTGYSGWNVISERDRESFRSVARAAIAFLRPLTMRDVEAKCKELVGRCHTSNHDDRVDLMDYLRANLPGGEA